MPYSRAKKTDLLSYVECYLRHPPIIIELLLLQPIITMATDYYYGHQ